MKVGDRSAGVELSTRARDRVGHGNQEIIPLDPQLRPNSAATMPIDKIEVDAGTNGNREVRVEPTLDEPPPDNLARAYRGKATGACPMSTVVERRHLFWRCGGRAVKA